LAYFDKDLLLVNITTAVSPAKSRVLVGKPEVKETTWEIQAQMGG